MASTGNQTVSHEKPSYIIRRSPNSRILLSRSLVALLLVYYVWILFSAWSMSGHWRWSLERGLYWTSGGPGSFIPIPSGPGVLTVISPANLIDQVFYLIFMHYGIWIVWIILGILYLFSPYRIDAGVVIGRIRGRG
jgi:hypothetical protein